PVGTREQLRGDEIPARGTPAQPLPRPLARLRAVLQMKDVSIVVRGRERIDRVRIIGVSSLRADDELGGSPRAKAGGHGKQRLTPARLNIDRSGPIVGGKRPLVRLLEVVKLQSTLPQRGHTSKPLTSGRVSVSSSVIGDAPTNRPCRPPRCQQSAPRPPT